MCEEVESTVNIIGVTDSITRCLYRVLDFFHSMSGVMQVEFSLKNANYIFMEFSFY